MMIMIKIKIIMLPFFLTYGIYGQVIKMICFGYLLQYIYIYIYIYIFNNNNNNNDNI